MIRYGMAFLHPGERTPWTPLRSYGHITFLLLMQTTEVMPVWLMISASDGSWMTHCEDYTGQLGWEAGFQWSFTAASSFLSHWGRGKWNTRQEVICKALPPLHQYSSWLKVYSYGVKDDWPVRLGKWTLRNEQVSHLFINQLILVGGIQQVKGCSVYSRLLANTFCFLSEVPHRAMRPFHRALWAQTNFSQKCLQWTKARRHKRRKHRIIKQNLL